MLIFAFGNRFLSQGHYEIVLTHYDYFCGNSLCGRLSPCTPLYGFIHYSEQNENPIVPYGTIGFN